jgi:hypothetical protein
MANMPDDLKQRLDRGGLFFQPDAEAMAIAEQASIEFGRAVGKVLAELQAEIAANGLGCTIQRVVDAGGTMQLVGLIEHLRGYAYQITPDDMIEESRLLLWEEQARMFLRNTIGRGDGWPRRMNGHTTPARPTQ